MQNPMPRVGPAWWPGGLTTAKAFRTRESMTASTAASTPRRQSRRALGVGTDGGVPGGKLLEAQQVILLNPLEVARCVAAQQFALRGLPGGKDRQCSSSPAFARPWMTASTRAGLWDATRP